MSVYSNTNIDWTNIIKLDSNGLSISDYPDIKKAIIDEFKKFMVKI